MAALGIQLVRLGLAWFGRPGQVRPGSRASLACAFRDAGGRLDSPESLSTAQRSALALAFSSPLEFESESLSLPSLADEAPAQKRDISP